MAENTTSSSKSQDGSILAQNAATSPTNSSTTSTSSSSSNRPYTLKHANSLISSGGSSAGSGTNAGAGGGSGKHHHHHHHHNYHHHHHGHHHGSSNSHVIHRTTSESLRLGTEIGGIGSGGGGGGGSSSSCGGGGGGSGSTSLSSSKNNNCGNAGGNSSSGANNNNNSNHSVNPSSHHHQLILNTPILSAPQAGAPSIQRKPKTSSFQIISVTDGSSSKLSTDNGEDSADDLDESHTDDNSRITDFENETPSFSEDTFSKEDVFFSSNALGTAPVIPTSSQYGLVIVDPDLGGVGAGPGQNISNVHVSVTDAGINIVGPGVTGKLGEGDQKDLHHRNERFKVVKIESTEPFKRGRWMCMDYLDHTTLQQPTQGKDTPSSGGATNDSGVVVTENHIDSGGEPPDVPSNYSNMSSTTNANSSPGQTLQNPINVGGIIEQQQNNAAVPAPSPSVAGAVGGVAVSLAGIAGGVTAGAGLHAQTVTHIRNVVPANVQQQNTPTQSLPQSQIHQAIAGQSQVPHGQPQTSQQTSDFQQQNTHQGQSQPAQFYTNNQVVGQNISAAQMHGATLPSNINVQHGVPTSLIPQNQQQAQQQQMPQQQMPQQQTQPQTQQTSTINQSQPPKGMSITMQPSATMTEQQIASAIPQNVIPAPNAATQPSGNMIATGQVTNSGTNVMQPQSAPQSQVSVDCFLPNQQPQAQSYAAAPVSAASVTNINNSASIVPTHSDISQQNQPQQPVEIGTGNTPVQSAVISPVGTATSTPQQNQPQQQSAICEETVSVQSQQAPLQIPIQDSMSQHQQAHITAMNEAMAAAASAIQAQQQAQAASLQTQQSIATNEEGLPQAAENDTESISSLALALIGPNKRSSSKPLTSFATMRPLTLSKVPSFPPKPDDSEIFDFEPCYPHYHRSQNLINPLKPGDMNQNFIQDNINTNLAFTKCDQNLTDAMATQKNEDVEKSSKGKYGRQESVSIPIPKSPKTDAYPTMTAFSAEPGYLYSLSASPPAPTRATAFSYQPTVNSQENRSFLHCLKDDSCLSTSASSTCSGGARGISLPESTRSAYAESSASGTSAVAIDNKIEQAMDLVKSHLMIAVREEVEVLKEKIAELMDRINQLELENTILKANVSQETLSQLSATMQQTTTKPSQNTNTSNGPVS